MGYNYSADYEPQAVKGIKHASSEMRGRIKSRVGELCEDPYRGTRMVGSRFYESRVSSSGGAYRMTYTINVAERKIRFHNIGKHKILGR